MDNFYIFIFFVLIFTLGFAVGFFIRQTRKEANRLVSQKETPRRSNQTNRFVSQRLRYLNTTIIRPTTNKTKQVINDIIND